MGTVFLYGNGGGGGAGGILTVTAPAGVAISVEKDGKVKRKTVNTAGVAVFKGLDTGTWLLTITDGEQTAIQHVNITADYNAMIAFFTATISITYPAGSTCTCSDGVTTLTAPDTSGTWNCIVPNTGTWTVSCTDGVETAEDTVEITTDGQSVSVVLAYWNGELYDAGNEFEGVTGGWVVDNYTSQGWKYGATFNTDNIEIALISGKCVGGVGTANAVDFSKYTKLKAKVTPSGSYTTTMYVLDQKGAVESYRIASTVSNGNTQQTLTIDISGISSGYVSFVTNGSCVIHSVWME